MPNVQRKIGFNQDELDMLEVQAKRKGVSFAEYVRGAAVARGLIDWCRDGGKPAAAPEALGEAFEAAGRYVEVSASLRGPSGRRRRRG